MITRQPFNTGIAASSSRRAVSKTTALPLAAAQHVSAARRKGFTLVELMITITIIGLLMSLALGALHRGRELSRENKTRAIISKLNTAIMARWDSFLTRRLPAEQWFNKNGVAELIYDGNDMDGIKGRGFAWWQLTVRREMMRRELPDRWHDVTGDTLYISDAIVGVPGSDRSISPPALTLLYQQYMTSKFPNYNANQANLDKLVSFESAECLYMILTVTAQESDLAESLSNLPIGDLDEDGLPEFLDGWGQPIRFLRWPAGFVADPTTDAPLSDLQKGNPETDHDPFDPRKIHMNYPTAFPLPNSTSSAFALYPLIYSSGSDGVPDILEKDTNFYNKTPPGYCLDTLNNLDPFRSWLAHDVNQNGSIQDTEWFPVGTPVDFDYDGPNHLDNIHNHQAGSR